MKKILTKISQNKLTQDQESIKNELSKAHDNLKVEMKAKKL